MILALVPVAFGVYLKRGRPARLVVTALAAVIAVLAALLPLSAYAIETKLDDSPFLWAVAELEAQIGVGDGSLSSRSPPRSPPSSPQRSPGRVSAGRRSRSPSSSSPPLGRREQVRRRVLAGRARAARRPRPGLGRRALWGRCRRSRPRRRRPGADRAALLEPVDRARAPPRSWTRRDRRVRQPTLAVGRDGTLLAGGRSAADGDPLRRLLRHARVHGRRAGRPVQVLLPLAPHGNAAPPAARAGALLRMAGSPRRARSRSGRARHRGTVTFTPLAPRPALRTRDVALRTATYHVEPGGDVVVRSPSTGPGPSTIPFRLLAGGNVVDDSLPVSVRSTIPHFAAAHGPTRPPRRRQPSMPRGLRPPACVAGRPRERSARSSGPGRFRSARPLPIRTR